MGEPKVPERKDDSMATISTTPAGELFTARSSITRELLDIRARLNRVQDTLAYAQYGDPSRLGADRGRVALAARMANEAAASVADLTFPAATGDHAA